jgi:hypothetical protein
MKSTLKRGHESVYILRLERSKSCTNKSGLNASYALRNSRPNAPGEVESNHRTTCVLCEFAARRRLYQYI